MSKFLEYILSEPLLTTQHQADLARSIILRETDIHAVQSRDGKPMERTRETTRRGSVAVVPVVGPIYRRADMFMELCGGVSTADLAKDITTALDDPMCSAIVLEIDSPGGEAAGIGELADLIADGTNRKPIVAMASHDCASGAYWLASACSEIVAAESATLGSIGAVMGYTERAPKTGETRYQWVSTQSPNKRPDLSTEAGNAVMQQRVDDLGAVFIGTVARNRDTTPEKVVSDFGGGGVLIASKAVAAGMADRIGTLEGLIAELNGNPSVQSPRKGRVPSAPFTSSQSITSEAFDMSWTPKALRKFMAKGMPENFDPVKADSEPDEPAKSDVIDLENAPTIKSLRDQVAQLQKDKAVADADRAEAQKDRAAANAERIEALATSFVQAEFTAGRILPGEAQALKSMYVLAAQDDAVKPLATGSRVQSLKDMSEARPKHGMFAQQVATDALPDTLRFLGSTMSPQAPRDPNTPPSKERVDEMLASFPAGRALLAQEKAKKSG